MFLFKCVFCVCMYVCMYVYVCILCMYICMCSCLFLCAYVGKYVVCVGVFLCACMYVEFTSSYVKIQKNTTILSGYSVLYGQVSIYDGWHTHGRHALL